MLSELFIALSIVVLAIWWMRRRRLRQTVEGRRPVVSDELLEEILDRGTVRLDDDPDEDELDEDAIREAEDRFWESSGWEDPEEY